MKRIASYLLAVLPFTTITAQKCLQLSIAPLVANLPMPVNAANSFMNCSTVVNGKGQTIIKRYSFDDLDSVIMRDNFNFLNPQPIQPGAPVDISPANPRVLPPQQGPGNPVMAAALPSQTAPAAMAKTAAVQSVASTTPTDNAATIQLVTQTYDIGVNQLAALDAELNGKLMALLMPMQNELNAVSMPPMSGCPMQQPGAMPGCACVNGLEDKYWTAKVAIEDKYDAQRTALLETYLPRIKALAAQVDANIAQLQYGDAVQTATYKTMLLNAQSAAFNNAINIEFTAIKNIDQGGADLYVHKYNADHLTEDISCQ